MICERYQELVSWQLDRELGLQQERDLKEHLAACADCRRFQEELRATHGDVARAMGASRAPEGMERRILDAARGEMDGIREEESRRRRRWMTRAGLVAASILAAIGLAALGVEQMRPTAQEVAVWGADTFEAASRTAFRVIVRDGGRRRPVANARVRARLGDRDLGTFTTDANGAAAAACEIPDLPEGAYTISFDVESEAGRDQVSRQVTIRRSLRVLLTSDKPLYQPGQTIHVRALALGAMTMRPAAAKTALVTVTDPKGNRVFKQELRTSEFGIAFCDVPLADELTPGRYRIAVAVDGVESEKTVEVKRYVLPKFKVQLDLEQGWYRPGETVRATARAEYLTGEKVAGEVKATLSAWVVDGFREFATARGRTDAGGAMRFELALPERLFGLDLLNGSALVKLEAVVVDGAGQTQGVVRTLTVSQRVLRVDVLPADGGFVGGVENRTYVVATYPDGTAAQATVEIGGQTVQTDAAGVAEVTLDSIGSVTVRAKDAKGNAYDASLDLRRFASSMPVILRTDRAVYRGGDAMKLTVLAPRQSGTIYVDLVKAGQTLVTSSLILDGGKAESTIDLPVDLFGTLQVSAYIVHPTGDIARVTRVAQVNLPQQLTVRPKLSKERYRPGDELTIDFEVVDREGRPVRGALGVSLVDEALYFMSESRPGMELVYFSLVEEMLRPSVEAHSAVFTMPVADLAEDERRMQIRRCCVHPDPGIGRILHAPFDQKLREFLRLKSRYREWIWAAFLVYVGIFALLVVALLYGVPVYGAMREGKSLAGPAFAFMCFFMLAVFAAAATRAIDAGCVAAIAIACVVMALGFHGVWWWIQKGRAGMAFAAAAIPMAGLVGLVGAIGLVGADRAAVPLARLKVEAAREEAPAGMAPPAPAIDPRREVPKPSEAPTTGEAAAPSKRGADPQVRVREYFPETLHWEPQLITDEHGRARLVVPGADSITTWRMITQAVSARGQLGSTATPVTVFQDFFVDIDFPVSLTQGDAVSVPVAVYNYLKEPQTVRLKVDREDWFELLDDEERTIELGAGEVRGARILVRAAKPGARRLTVRAFGSKGLTDAVRREVEIRPDGREMPVNASDRLGDAATARIVIPGEAIDGGTVVVVRLSPAGIGEVVRGLDSLIGVPDG